MINIGSKPLMGLYHGADAVSKVYRGADVVWQRRRLPDEYQQVEYLESTGEQWIDTGVIPDELSGYRLKLSNGDVTRDFQLNGCRNDTYDTRYTIGTYLKYVYFGFGKTFANGRIWTVSDNTPFSVSFNFFNSGLANVNGLNSYAFKGEYTLPVIWYNYLLFGISFGRGNILASQKIFSFEMTYGDNLIRNMIPCYRKSDFKPGMYDIVSKQFFVNQGTGADFIVGPEV